jgi:hypothetical protein
MKTSDSALQPALLKLVEIIEEENGFLSRGEIVSHAGFTDRKNHALREVVAAQRLDSKPEKIAECRSLLERLSSVLKTNAKLLKLHIGAVGEVSDIIIGCLREAESDGTYSRGLIAGRR